MNIHAFLIALAITVPALAEDKPAAPPPAATPDATVFAPNDLAKLKEMNGKPVVVEGTVAAQGENKSATIRYLNFSKNYKETISLVFLVSQGGEEFAKEKLTPFVGKKVRVSGTVGTYNDALQIKIDKLDQIKVQP
jgi:DNA/RNA endonuclease YhcR with UshA esterase domain